MEQPPKSNIYALNSRGPKLPKTELLEVSPYSLSVLQKRINDVKNDLNKNQDMLDEVYDRINNIEYKLLELTSYVAEIARILEKHKLL